MQAAVDRHVAVDGMYYLHPFDDLHLIAGMARYLLDRICYKNLVLRTVPTIVTAHTFCASQDTRVSYG